jgi:hypothetical protein
VLHHPLLQQQEQVCPLLPIFYQVDVCLVHSKHSHDLHVTSCCTQVWRVPENDALYSQLLPRFDQLPLQFQHATNYHLGIHVAHPPMMLLAALQQAAHQQGGEQF